MDDHGKLARDVDRDDPAELRARLAEAEETLRAIREGEVDALLIADASGERVYTLRTADAPYRALVEQMQEGAVTLNASRDIMYCNKRFAELVNAPLQQVIGASLDQFVDVADRAELSALIAAGSGTLRTRLRRDGELPLDAHVSVSQVRWDGAEYHTLIVSDVRTLTKMQRESRSKDEFLAVLAHELRNPLAAIGGAARVLGLADIREPAAIRAREIVQRQARHMGRLVDDLLDVGRVMMGKIVLDRRPVDLAESVPTCVSVVTAGMPAGRVVEVAVESVWVAADPVRLEQVVCNLLSNALRFTPTDRRIRVVVLAEGADAVLRVEDEGIGIDPGFLRNIFELFAQGGVRSDQPQEGLGIGLTLVRRLVELHGGTVEASSRGKDCGSTFTVRLPAVDRPAATAAAALSDRRPAARRVLLVDDNPDAREMQSLLLRADGHDVYEAADGPGALGIIGRARPDVAIIDIGLPGMDGYELARRIRSRPDGRNVRLLAVTGYGMPEHHERSRAAGFDRHLVKPVALEELRRAMDEPGKLAS